MVMFVLVFATLIAIYAFWIRPILQSRPAFRELYDKEESFFAALREKLKGIKQKLSSAIVIVASVAVTGYDFFAPIVSGVDVSSLTSQGAVLGVAARSDRDDRALPVPPQSCRQATQGRAGRRVGSGQGGIVPCGPGLPASSAGPSSPG